MSLREAAQQALEALEENGRLSAMEILRTALAEPRKYISYVCPQCHWTLDTNPVDDTALLRQALEALEQMLDDAKHERVTVTHWNGCVDTITALRERLGEKK